MIRKINSAHKTEIRLSILPIPIQLKMDGVGIGMLTKRNIALFVLIAGLFIAIRLWHLTTFDLWADEITTLQTVQLDWRAFTNYVLSEIVHPPLFYVPIKLWVEIGGESLLWLKLFPVRASIISIVLFVLLCRELNLEATEINFALLLTAFNGYMIYYSQEFR